MFSVSPAATVSGDDSYSGPGSGPTGSYSVALLVWYLLARTFITTLFLGGTVFLSQFYPGGGLFDADLRLLFLLSITFLQICISLVWLLRRQVYSRLFIQIQLGWDLLLSFFVVYITGGAASLFPFLFIFVILSSALVATRKDLYTTVVAAVVFYTGLVGLQYYAYLPMVYVSLPLDNKEIIYRLFLNLVTFVLAGILGNILSLRLRRSEQLLQRKREDYAALEQLNSVILQNIPSGLIVVDASGKINLFNVAAATMCAISSSDAYKKKISDIFPELIIDKKALPVDRGEFSYVNEKEEQRIIGYNAIQIQQDGVGMERILITFQDLTDAKKLEYSLQLGERLAAVGKLAAGLAHEIRNPLASLGGSIQLLAEQVDFKATNQKLFAIIQRETERLNRLVSDFLVFAKPQMPVLIEGDLIETVNEVVMLAKSDPLFAQIQVELVMPKAYLVRMDKAQIHQALWNLLVNAVQFAQQPKHIVVGVDSKKGLLWVDDNGVGVNAENKMRMFDPFYTTRPAGTGLGLSIVHAIISAHGWSIECAENSWGGARFQIVLGDKEATGK